jgi:Prasinovirus endonuclease
MWMDFRFFYVASGDASTRDPLGVVDGDTLNLYVDKGIDEYRKLTVRLYGVNAPELSTQAGKDAKAWVISWFEQHCPDGLFVLGTIKDNRDKYGRYLANIYAADGAVLNDDLVAAGQAVPYFPK